MTVLGDAHARKHDTDRLIALVYHDLRRIAAGYLRRERSDHTLEPTALVNEAYLQLAAAAPRAEWQDRSHFIGIAARVMRRVLREHARRRIAAKRNPGAPLLLDDTLGFSGRRPFDTLDLERALEKLAQLDPEVIRVVELRYFGGLTIEETSSQLELSPATVKRHWTVAKAFLCREMAK